MRILVIEDDEILGKNIKEQLEAHSYQVDLCNNGGDAVYYIQNGVYDAMVFDRMLPEIDGLTLLQKMRKSGNHTPVIMVTAMNGLSDRVDGLDNGADDYLVKPFEMEELLARIRALLRRPKEMDESDIMSFGDLSFHKSKFTLNCNGISARLSKREGAMIEFFLMNSCQIVTREQILSRVWGNDSFVEDGNIDNYIHILRKRLKAIQSQVTIKTVYGVGYQVQILENS